MPQRKSLFPRQLLPLLVAFAGILGLSIWLQHSEQEPGISRDEQLLQSIPQIPYLSGWPDAFYEQLKEAHLMLGKGQWSEGFRELGLLYLVNGYSAEARQCFKMLALLEPEEGRWLYYQILTLQEHAASEEDFAVSALLQDLLQLKPDFHLAWSMLVSNLLETGSVEAAHEVAKRARERFSESAYSYLDLGKAALGMGNDLDAIAQGREALERDPGLASAYDLLEEAYDRQGLFEELVALENARSALARPSLRLDPWIQERVPYHFGAQVLESLADQALEAGEGELALAYLQRAVALEPDNEQLAAALETARTLFEK